MCAPLASPRRKPGSSFFVSRFTRLDSGLRRYDESRRGGSARVLDQRGDGGLKAPQIFGPRLTMITMFDQS